MLRNILLDLELLFFMLARTNELPQPSSPPGIGTVCRLGLDRRRSKDCVDPSTLIIGEEG